MSRPYATRGKEYAVRLPSGASRLLPTRATAGMAYTCDRQKNQSDIKPEVRRLITRGTLDPLGGYYGFGVPVACPCCGAKTGNVKRALDPHKQYRLRALRAKYKEKQA